MTVTGHGWGIGLRMASLSNSGVVTSGSISATLTSILSSLFEIASWIYVSGFSIVVDFWKSGAMMESRGK